MMNQNNRRGDRYRKNDPKSIAIAAAVLVLLQIFSAADRVVLARSSILIILVAVLAIALSFFVFWVIGKSVKKTEAEEKSSRKADGYCNTCSDEFVYNNRQNEYNENSAEQNFNRDKQRRIRQLDDFLKNGIIDKDEYLKLRSRYERQ